EIKVADDHADVVNAAPTQLSNGRTTPLDFGSPGDARSTQTYTVTNYGDATLTLGPVNLPAGFTLVKGLATSLEPGNSDTLTVALDPRAAQPRAGQISFTTNDPDDGVFQFAVAPRDVLSLAAQSVDATVGQEWSGQVATLMDLTSATRTVPFFQASINWGDGQMTAGLVVANGDGSF